MARENIDVTVSLADHLSRPAKRAERHVEQLVDATEELNRELRELQAEQLKAAAATEALGRAMGTSRKHKKAAKRELKGYRDEANESRGAFRALGNAISNAGKKSQGLGKALGVLKLPALISAVTMAATAIGALGVAAFGAAAGLAAIGQAAVGVMGALPALLSMFGQVFATVKIGFGGLGEALKVLNDPTADAEALREALGKLGPEARELVTLLSELKEQTAGWKEQIQAAMLPGFTDAVRNLGGLLPEVEKGLVGSAGAIGDIARQGGSMVGTWGTDLGWIMARNTRMIQNGLGPALLSVLSILKDLMIAGGPLAERMANAIGRFAQKMAWLVAEGRHTGRLEAFFHRSAELLLRVWNVLKDFTVGLINMGKEATAVTGWMGDGIESAAAKFRAWTESVEGKASIRDYFEKALPILQEFTGLLGDVLAMFGRMAVDDQLLPTIQGLRDDVLPAFEALSTSLTANLGPALTDLLTAFLEFSNVLSFNPLVTAVGIFADFARAVTGVVELSPGLSTFIATLLTIKTGAKLFGVASKMTGLGAAVESMTSKTGKLRVFTQALRGNTKALEANNTQSRFAAKLGGGLRKVLGGIKTAAVTAGKAMYGALGPWGIALIAIIALVTLLWFHSEDFRELVYRIRDALVAFGKKAWEVIKGVAAAVWDFLVAAWEAVVPIVVGVASTIWSVVTKAFELVWGVVDRVMHWIMNVVRTTANVFKAVFQVIMGIAILVFRGVIMPIAKVVFGAIQTYLRLLMAYWRVVFGVVRTVAETVFNAIAAVAGWLWGVIQTGAGFMRDVLATVWSAIQAAGEAVWGPIQTVASAVWGGIQTGFEGLQTILGGIWDGIRAAGEAVWDPIKTAATTVIDAIKGLFRGLGTVASGIWSGIQSAFGTAINVIIGVINRVIDTLNVAIRAFKKLPGDQDISEIPNIGEVSTAVRRPPTPPRSNARFAGGDVWPGTTFMTGELGAELFVPKVGPVSVVGAGGPELARFAGSGYIVPNPSTPASVAKPVPDWVTDRLERSLPTAGAHHPHAGGGGTAVAEAPVPIQHIHMHGDGSALTVEDVKRASLEAYRKFERERKERR